MSFFNPFRKSQHPEGVRLASMTSEGDAPDEAPTRSEPFFDGARQEPSLGSNAGKLSEGSTLNKTEADDAAPPPFAFSEAPKSSPVPFEQELLKKAAAAPTAPWDPYGIRTPEKTEESEPETQKAPDVGAEAVAADAPQIPAAPIKSERAPEPAAAESEIEPGFEPQREVPQEGEGGLKPALEPVPREQLHVEAFSKEKAAQKPVRRVPTEEELIARRRTKHRMVGAAVLIMAAVVAAPFVIDNEPAIERTRLESVATDIPKESETSTTLEVPKAPLNKRAQPGDVDVTDTSLGRMESTTKANLAREAKAVEDAKRAAQAAKQAPTKAQTQEAKKTEAKPQAAKPQKSAGINPPTGHGWYVQVVATSREDAAEAVVKKLALLGLPAYRTTDNGTLWKVRVGLYSKQAEAEGARGTIVLNGVSQKPYLAQQ